MSTSVMLERPPFEIADVIRLHQDDFVATHGSRLTREQRRVLRDLAACRTAALGGHVERCLDCGAERIAYNSCRNRHCPKCQALARARWLEREAENLLPVEYHHVVFTLPAELSVLALANATQIYDHLFRAAATTLREVAANPKHLGAAVGVLMVLHTWGQNLHHHPHVHCVVTGGGLSCNSQGSVDASPRWLACRPGFFLPVRVLSRLFRGKFLALLHTSFAHGRLDVPESLASAAAFAAWLTPLYRKDWVVYAKPPFGGPAQVLKYLARYTHRVAISNRRLVKLEHGRVTFRYKDYADGHHAKVMTLDAVEFLRRFVQHVLPRGFVKVRHYGLLANRHREQRLAQCRRLLFVALVVMDLTSVSTVITPAELPRCPHCGGYRLVRSELTRHASIPGSTPQRDTS